MVEPRLKQVFGYPDKEVPDSFEWVRSNAFPEDLASALDGFKEHLEKADHPYDQIVRFKHKDGSTVWVRSRGVIIRNDEGEAVRMLGVHSDITDLMRADQALEQANRELTRSNRELEQFSFLASHDLREPLRKIIAFIDQLENEHAAILPDDAQDRLSRIHGAALRMQSLVDSILDCARVDSHGAEFTDVDLNEVVRNVVGDLEVQIQETEGRVEIGQLPTVFGDPTQMYLLFQNLISNAIKFRDPDEPPVVRVEASDAPASDTTAEAETNSAFAEITVSDNGIGIDLDHREQVFEMFRRLHGRSEYGGAGIGLAICRKIVSRHHGTIELRSPSLKGSTFAIRLPLHAIETAEPATTEH